MSIARSLSHEVRLLIMDEPSAILDDSEIETLFDVVRRLTAEGVGVVYISHRLDEIRRIGDRVTVLREGATVVSGLPASTPSDELVTHMVGTAFEQLFPERATGGGRVLLEVRDLQRLPDVKAASFDLHAGEVLGIAGLVGAGRSELLRAIYGVDRRDSGEVVLDGEPLPAGPPGPRHRGGDGPGPRGPQVPGPAAGLGPDQERDPPRRGPVPAGPDPGEGRAGRRPRPSSPRCTPRRPTAAGGLASSPAATSRRSCWPAGC